MTFLLDAAAHCMQELPTQVEEQYLTTKSLLISSQWKFSHCCRGLCVPKVVMNDDDLPSSTYYLPGNVLHYTYACGS